MVSHKFPSRTEKRKKKGENKFGATIQYVNNKSSHLGLHWQYWVALLVWLL